MSNVLHKRTSLILLTVAMGLVFAGNAFADGGSASQPSTGDAKPMKAALLQFEVVEVAAKTLSTATDQSAESDKIIAAVRGAVKDGSGRVRFTFEAPTAIGSELSLTAGTQEPFLRNRVTTKEGKSNSQVDYENTGCSVDVRTYWLGDSPEDGIGMKWNLQLEDLRTESGVDISERIEAPLFLSQKVQMTSIIVPGKAIAFRMGSQRPLADDARIFVVIAKITLPDSETARK